jgi:bifunctional DNase/RNase
MKGNCLRPGVILVVLMSSVLALAACRHESAPKETSPVLIKMSVKGVGIDHRTGLHYVLLRAQNGEMSLPIKIDDSEARTIMMAIHGLRSPRPESDELLGTVIETTGNRVDRVVISKLRNDVYYADIYLDEGRLRIDSRPSDAIALAMNVDAPIYVAKPLLDLNRRADTAIELPATRTGFGLTVQALTPGLAPYFHAAPASGVLVVVSDGAARSAGLRQGDIVQRIGSVQVRSLDEFSRVAASLSKADRVPITVNRDGATLQATIAMTSAPHS